jgi:hypothetical protein
MNLDAWNSLTPEQIRNIFFLEEPLSTTTPYWWERRSLDYMTIYNNIEAKLKEVNT